jgi:hypothetical protein
LLNASNHTKKEKLFRYQQNTGKKTIRLFLTWSLKREAFIIIQLFALMVLILRNGLKRKQSDTTTQRLTQLKKATRITKRPIKIVTF